MAVQSINWHDNGQPNGPAVIVTTRTGESFTAAHLILALAPTMSSRITFSPPLPAWRDQLERKMPAGAVIKCYLVYDRPFWRDVGLNGQGAYDKGPVKVVFDNSPPSGTPGVLMGFFEAAEAQIWGRATPEQRRDEFTNVAVELFGELAARPLEYIERDWSDEEFTRGCYGAHFAPGAWTSIGQDLRRPVGPIRWAGAEYSAVWNGYMEGAVRSGEAAAADVMAETSAAH